MPIPKKPENFYVNRDNVSAVLVWDKVFKDINQNYVMVDGYYISSTPNPNGTDWGLIDTMVNTDQFIDKDVFYIHYSSDNLLYRVCAFIGSEIGECATSIGIVTDGVISVPASALWDVAGWDVDSWG